MLKSRGPDWGRFVRTHVRLPQMARHREARMLAELAVHLEDVYRDALSRGVGEDEARARAERRHPLPVSHRAAPSARIGGASASGRATAPWWRVSALCAGWRACWG